MADAMLDMMTVNVKPEHNWAGSRQLSHRLWRPRLPGLMAAGFSYPISLLPKQFPIPRTLNSYVKTSALVFHFQKMPIKLPRTYASSFNLKIPKKINRQNNDQLSTEVNNVSSCRIHGLHFAARDIANQCRNQGSLPLGDILGFCHLPWVRKTVRICLVLNFDIIWVFSWMALSILKSNWNMTCHWMSLFQLSETIFYICKR